MRVVEHRRHARRDPLGGHLAPEGVELARRVGRTVGRFDRVVTSSKPRAVETALAMGLRVDRELEELERMPDEVEARVDETRPKSFGEYAELVRHSSAVASYARAQADLWARELEPVPEGGRLLLVSHGGVIELGAVAAVPGALDSAGPPLGYLEGVRLTRDRGRWVRADLVRLPEP